MYVACNIRLYRPIRLLAFIAVLLLPFYAIAGGQRPAIHQIEMQGETLANLTASAGGGAVAQEGVAAAIYRSTGCGFQSWIGGQPAWLDQMVLFNDGVLGAPLRSYTARVCYDTCHRGDRCIGGTGPADCDCLSCDKFPFDANLQLYDGDPCGAGVAIAGTQGTITITTDDIPCDQLGDGDSHCFTLTVNVDPKVQIPHDVWIEVLYGIDDSWAITGRPNTDEGQGESNLSGLDDGVICSTFCDIGPPACTNDPDRCDWLLASVDANAAFAFTLQPTRSTGGGIVVDNEIILAEGGQTVFLDVILDDWVSPDIRAWQAGIDSSGYTSALQGTLTQAAVPCPNGQADCDAFYGGGSVCGGGASSGTCTYAYIDSARTDYIFSGAVELPACSFSTPNMRCASILLARSVLSPGRDSYLWTLSVDVPPRAKGTFTIPLKLPPDTSLLSSENQLLPLVGVVPGKITIPIGRCCYDLDAAEPGCLDFATRPECNAQPGLNTFQPGGTCETSCTECLPSSEPATEMFGFDVVAKNRYLSIEAGDPGRLQAIRVTAVNLPPPYDVWNGQQWFAGTPIGAPWGWSMFFTRQ